MSKSDFKFLDLNRLGVSVKLDFAELLQLYGTADVLQLDTGIIGGSERDIVIRIFEGKRENTEIIADEEYEILTFNSDDLVTGDHPRMHLWDSYALKVGDRLLMANRKGMPLNGDLQCLLQWKAVKTMWSLKSSNIRELLNIQSFQGALTMMM